MRRALLVFLTMACIPAAAADEAVLRFVNGDQLSGSLVSLDGKNIVWNSSLMEKPIPFITSKVLDLSLSSQMPKREAADHEAVVTLTNGNVVRGRLSEVTGDTVVLDTWYAGQLRLNRVMVDQVNIESSDAVLYQGPNSLDGWKVWPKEGVWKYSNFSLLCEGEGAIARDNLLTDTCSVAFDVEWKGDSSSFKVVIFSDSAESREPKSGFELSMQRGSMVLRNIQTGTYLGNAHASELAEGNQLRVEIKASRKTGDIALFINDKIVERWRDADMERSQLGSGLHFIVTRRAQFRFSRIRVAEWDGTIDQLLPPRGGMRRFQRGFEVEDETLVPPAPEENEKGRMKLANGDSMAGSVKSIQDGKVTVSTFLGDVVLPVARLRTVTLPPAAREEPIRRDGDVRGWMLDGSSIVFRLDAADDDTITGSSQNFGTATFRRDAFQRIEFDIHNIILEEMRKQSDW